MPAPTARLPTTTHPFTGWNVPRLIATQAATRPNAPCLVWRPADGVGQSWTYAELAHDVARLAGGLRRRGIAAGDFVVIHMDNRPAFLIAYLACLHLGAVAVTTNARSSSDELAYFAEHCGARAAITEGALLPTLRASGHRFELVATADAPDGELDLSELFDSPCEAAPSGPLDRASVQYTSGTTSRPKGVVFTHANILWAGRVCASHVGLGAANRTLVLAPLFHVNALFYSVMATLWAGGTIVLVPKFSRSRFWGVVEQERIDWLSIQPFAVRALAKDPAPKHGIRLLGLGAADVPWIEGPLGAPTLGWWGMTETISHGIYTVPGWRSRPMSMGRPAPEYEIKVVDAAGVQVVPTREGARGRLWVRGIAGLSMFYEYLGNPQATAAAFDGDGWFDTGDVVVCFDDGEIAFGDREKDMLRVGGENVAASEIERVILEVPGVVEAAVVGKPDEMLDEVPVGFVLGMPGKLPPADHIIAHCAAKLAAFKVPRDILVVEELPRTLLDKVSKAELRARLSSPVGDEAASG